MNRVLRYISIAASLVLKEWNGRQFIKLCVSCCCETCFQFSMSTTTAPPSFKTLLRRDTATTVNQLQVMKLEAVYCCETLFQYENHLLLRLSQFRLRLSPPSFYDQL
mmetsp:Transcript_16364/g.25490  ORF Transcript_16364/g.25490 Transcript_16364/m.25490 type:complete len:107 (-) Transcript_16364:813-1133(-)